MRILTKINQNIPKWTWTQTNISKAMYQDKVDIIWELIKKIDNKKFTWKYSWEYDFKINMPYIKIKFWNFEWIYHIKEKQKKVIKTFLKNSSVEQKR